MSHVDEGKKKSSDGPRRMDPGDRFDRKEKEEVKRTDRVGFTVEKYFQYIYIDGATSGED